MAPFCFSNVLLFGAAKVAFFIKLTILAYGDFDVFFAIRDLCQPVDFVLQVG